MSPSHLELHISSKDFEIKSTKKKKATSHFLNGLNILHIQFKGTEEFTVAARIKAQTVDTELKAWV